MYSKLSISNGALQKIGVPRIMSIDEQSKEAKICASEFDKAKKTVLRLYPWSFASTRVRLAPDPVTPAFEFEYAFQLPIDYLRVIELWEYEGEWKIEGTQLLANTNDIALKYVFDIQDLSRIDSLFAECLEWWLAYSISRYLTESETVRAEAHQGFKQTIPMAKFVQSTESSQKSFEALDLLESRIGSRFVRDPGTH